MTVSCGNEWMKKNNRMKNLHEREEWILSFCEELFFVKSVSQCVGITSVRREKNCLLSTVLLGTRG